MADAFERLLTSPPESLVGLISGTRVGPLDDPDSRRDRIAAQLGVNTIQLVCAIGFHPERTDLENVMRAIGFSNVDALINQRNYAFIHDQYRDLSINNVLLIHQMLGRAAPLHPATRDVVMSRLEMLENQLEETINPILVGSFKLEVRGIYESGVADRNFGLARLSPSYQQSRALTDETRIMLETRTVSSLDVLREDSVPGDEKRHLVFHGLVSSDDLEAYLADPEIDQDFKRELEGRA